MLVLAWMPIDEGAPSKTAEGDNPGSSGSEGAVRGTLGW
jgi:hypothetical protein